MKEVHAELIEEVVAFFNQGALLKSQRTEKGQSNISYYVRTTNGVYALRFFTDFNPLRFHNEEVIQGALESGGMRYASLAQAPNGQRLFNKDGIYATLSPWIDGHHLSRPLLPITVERIGVVMAQFHLAIDPKTEVHSRYLFTGEERRYDRLARIPEELLKDEVVEMLQRAEGKILPVPQGVLHGDVHLDNILADKHGTLTLLDFQSSGKGGYVYDIGRSIADICNNKGSLDIPLTKSYIRGYCRIRPLEDAELKSLRAAIIVGACSIALWAFEKKKFAMRDEYLKMAQSARTFDVRTLFIN